MPEINKATTHNKTMKPHDHDACRVVFTVHTGWMDRISHRFRHLMLAVGVPDAIGPAAAVVLDGGGGVAALDEV